MEWTVPKVYAVQHLESSVVETSRSGGVFTALSDCVFDKGGVGISNKLKAFLREIKQKILK